MTKNYPLNPRFTLPFAFLLAVSLLAVSLLFMLPIGSVHAQQSEEFFTYAENGTGPVAAFTATDPEGVSFIGWSLPAANTTNIDGVDVNFDVDAANAGDFKIDQNGVLSFMTPPNFEMPRGLPGSTNTYRVVVQASDGNNNDYFKVTVTVIDEDEPGKVTWVVDPSPQADATEAVEGSIGLLQFRPGALLDATVTDPDITTGTPDDDDITWQWYRSSSRSATGTAITGETNASYMVSDSPTNNDVGMYIRVVATYRVGSGRPQTVSFVSENPVQVFSSATNRDPDFASPEVIRRIVENSDGNVGGPVTATDADGDLLTYTLGGEEADDVALFDINAATGQLMVERGQTVDYDVTEGNSRTVTVTATDSSGGAGTTNVTINVTGVNDKPMFTFGPEGFVPAQPEGMASIDMDPSTETVVPATFTATDPEGGVTLSLIGDDAGSFELNDPDPAAPGSKVLAFKAMPDFEMPGDQNRDNIYEVTVRASDGALHADRMVAVKVIDANDTGTVTLSSQDALIGVELTATLSDSDGGLPDPAQFTDQKWMWHRFGTDAVPEANADLTGCH